MELEINTQFVHVRYDVQVKYHPEKDYPLITNKVVREMHEDLGIKAVRYKCETNVGQIVQYHDDEQALTFGHVGKSEKECPSVKCNIGENYFDEKTGQYINWYFDGYENGKD